MSWEQEGQHGDRAEYLEAMARAVNGVAILSTDGPAGRFGLTVSTVTSVSADPPLLLVCVNRRSPAHAALVENGVFGVSLLSTHQRELADAFAGRPTRGPAYSFADRLWRNGSSIGAPLLEGAVAAFECTVVRRFDAGSHAVFLGRVERSIGRAGEALLYTGRSYGQATRHARPETTDDAPVRAHHASAA